MLFPLIRLRRLRSTETIRRLVRETKLSIDDFVYPLFVIYGKGVRNPIQSMPGVYQLSIDNLVKEVQEVANLRIPAILLFGIPETKDAVGSSAYDPHGIVQEAVRAVKNACPELLVITDVCLCEYTDHGHCGPITSDNQNATVVNDATLELIAKTALSHAQAGADMVAPSGMMDGQVKAVRTELDANGFDHIPIMAYSAKYASSFYGPFRDAAESAPKFGDRRSYQMDIANSDEALREVRLDIEEGADIVMVKPALSYLDIIRRVKEQFGYPLAAYNVSGEYAMVKAAAQKGCINEKRIALEILTSIKRAGADIILTYFAKDFACWYQE
ncbi:porphobilinogen synthase [Candidatus Poribacteria bacterium]|nr:porphobilinogen synthase [Candidatus Poribacteria bacterium]